MSFSWVGAGIFGVFLVGNDHKKDENKILWGTLNPDMALNNFLGKSGGQGPKLSLSTSPFNYHWYKETLQKWGAVVLWAL